MKYFSTFTGIGGFELGIKQAYESSYAHRGSERGSKENKERDKRKGLFAEKGKDISSEEGWTGKRSPDLFNERPLCVGYSEINKYADQIYQKHFPEHKNYGDITKIDADTLPDFDLLVGGFPCQAFSIAGKRKGFDDTRGTLFFDLARILKAKKPRLFVFENVKGLLSHDNGNTFKTIISTIDELGYDCQWQVLNSKNHGVPQNRERVFIVGYLRGTSRPQVFPFGQINSNSLKQIVKGTQANRVYDISGIAKTQSCATGGQGAKTGLYKVYVPETTKSGISPTLNTMQGGNRQPFIHSVVPGGNKEKRYWRESNITATLTAGQFEHANSRVFAGARIRRLTPLECERLQGFPDGWTEGVSDTQRYKTLGNAVTVNVVKAVIGSITPPLLSN